MSDNGLDIFQQNEIPPRPSTISLLREFLGVLYRVYVGNFRAFFRLSLITLSVTVTALSRISGIPFYRAPGTDHRTLKSLLGIIVDAWIGVIGAILWTSLCVPVATFAYSAWISTNVACWILQVPRRAAERLFVAHPPQLE